MSKLDGLASDALQAINAMIACSASSDDKLEALRSIKEFLGIVIQDWDEEDGDPI